LIRRDQAMNAKELELELYLRTLFGRAPHSSFVELRWRTDDGMRQRFVPAAELDWPRRSAVGMAEATDVFVGVLPRARRRGDRGSLTPTSHVAWVDLDTPDAARVLQSAPCPPHLVVASGGAGHLHAYWRLTAPVGLSAIERANRRLALALDGDLQCADAARILRPAGTVNHKRGRARVRIVSAADEPGVSLADLVGGLDDPQVPSPATTPATRQRSASADRLLDVTPAEYVQALTGQVVGRSRKVRCPLHDDRTPSLHVYEEPSAGWYCFGCGRGGTVYDLAAGLWFSGQSSGVRLRDSRFIEVRERLMAIFSERSRRKSK
jgi:hypothetical protein